MRRAARWAGRLALAVALLAALILPLTGLGVVALDGRGPPASTASLRTTLDQRLEPLAVRSSAERAPATALRLLVPLAALFGGVGLVALGRRPLVVPPDRRDRPPLHRSPPRLRGPPLLPST